MPGGEAVLPGYMVIPDLCGDVRCLRGEPLSSVVCLTLCLVVGERLRDAEGTGSSVYRKAAAVKTPGFRSVVLMVSGATVRWAYILGSGGSRCGLSHTQTERKRDVGERILNSIRTVSIKECSWVDDGQ